MPNGGFEGYFDAGERIAAGAMHEDERAMARADLGERYGITWRDDPIPGVEVRFGMPHYRG